MFHFTAHHFGGYFKQGRSTSVEERVDYWSKWSLSRGHLYNARDREKMQRVFRLKKMFRKKKKILFQEIKYESEKVGVNNTGNSTIIEGRGKPLCTTANIKWWVYKRVLYVPSCCSSAEFLGCSGLYFSNYFSYFSKHTSWHGYLNLGAPEKTSDLQYCAER